MYQWLLEYQWGYHDVCGEVSVVNRQLVIAHLNGVFILFSPLKDLSAEQLVTGRVERILIRAVMLGYMELTCLRVSMRLVGKLLSPWSLNCCCHFVCQQCSSLSKHSGDGRLPSYRSASSLTLEMLSVEFREINSKGTMERPSIAVLWWLPNWDCNSEKMVNHEDGDGMLIVIVLFRSVSWHVAAVDLPTTSSWETRLETHIWHFTNGEKPPTVLQCKRANFLILSLNGCKDGSV